jgi:hypothetical protein
MTTLQSLKQALDSRKTITDSRGNLIYKRDCQYWYDSAVHEYGGAFPCLLERVIPDPSDWRIRDHKPIYDGAGTDWIRKDETGQYAPRMVVVDAREWEGIQAELHELRQYKQNTVDPITPEQERWMENEMETAISAIADKHKEVIDNAHYNMMATGHAMVVVKDAGKCILTSKFSPSNDEEK